ncbi:MAG: MFS transporter [Armatimonadetes bacterium]|nr:MFS transporter [Armatimonadota bacterium]
MNPRRGALAAVAFAAFFDTFALAPVLSKYAQSIGADGFWIGLILSVYSLANLGFSFVSGPLIDRFGRQRPMWISLALTAPILFGYGLCDAPWQLLILRILHGAAGAVFLPSLFTYAMDRGSPAKAAGRLGAVIAAVAVVAPPISGQLAARYGYQASFALAGGMMLVGAVAALAWVSEPREPREKATVSILSLKAAISVALMTFSMTCALSMLPYRLPLVMADARAAGQAFGIYALAAFIVMWRYRNGSMAAAVAGVLVAMLATGAIAFLTADASLYLAMGWAGFGFGLAFPSLNSLAHSSAPDAAKGRAMALFYGAYSLGYGAGPLIYSKHGIAGSLVLSGFSLLLAGTIFSKSSRNLEKGRV